VHTVSPSFLCSSVLKKREYLDIFLLAVPKEKYLLSLDTHTSGMLGIEVSQAKRQHRIAVAVLKQLGLDNIRLERTAEGTFKFFAWTVPLRNGNGSLRKAQRGQVRVRS
jgi:hypothetical protein